MELSNPAPTDLAGQIVSAYISNHPVDAGETRDLLGAVASVMLRLAGGIPASVPETRSEPAVPP